MFLVWAGLEQQRTFYILLCLRKVLSNEFKPCVRAFIFVTFCAFLALSDVLKLIFTCRMCERMCDICKIEFLFLGFRRKFNTIQRLSTCTEVFASSTRKLQATSDENSLNDELWDAWVTREGGATQVMMLGKFSTCQRIEADTKISTLRYLKTTLQKNINYKRYFATDS